MEKAKVPTEVDSDGGDVVCTVVGAELLIEVDSTCWGIQITIL